MGVSPCGEVDGGVAVAVQDRPTLRVPVGALHVSSVRAASLMARAKRWLASMPDTLRSSTATRGHWASVFAAGCGAWCFRFLVCWWGHPSGAAAFLLFFDPFGVRVRARASRRCWAWACCRCFGAGCGPRRPVGRCSHGQVVQAEVHANEPVDRPAGHGREQDPATTRKDEAAQRGAVVVDPHRSDAGQDHRTRPAVADADRRLVGRESLSNARGPVCGHESDNTMRAAVRLVCRTAAHADR